MTVGVNPPLKAGQAAVVRLDNDNYPHLVLAPDMRSAEVSISYRYFFSETLPSCLMLTS